MHIATLRGERRSALAHEECHWFSAQYVTIVITLLLDPLYVMGGGASQELTHPLKGYFYQSNALECCDALHWHAGR